MSSPPKPFFVFSLPRSRTAWLSKFLTYGKWVCGHEEFRHMQSLDDVKLWFSQPFIGSIETLATPYWRLAPTLVPDTRILVVRRPVEEVLKSLMNTCPGYFDETVLRSLLTRLDLKLNQLSKRLPNVLVVDFSDLDDEETCAKVFEYCLEEPFDRSHWLKLKDQNIQINLDAMMRYMSFHKSNLDKFGNKAKEKILSNLALTRRVMDPTGITIRSESFEEWFEDGQEMFSKHCIEVGEPDNQWKFKNIPLIKRLYDSGCMQIMVARSNGRVFGYLVTLITPSLVSEDITYGVHTMFFASPEFPGLGLKLQRAANQALKDRDVSEIFMQAGTRGSGERVASIFKRLGAESVGHSFRINLKD